MIGWLWLYLSDVFVLHLRPLDFPFIAEHCEERIRHNLGQAKTPDERDGIEEVRVAGACVYPEIVEGRAQQGRVEYRGHGEEGVSHHCGISVRVNLTELVKMGKTHEGRYVYTVVT